MHRSLFLLILLLAPPAGAAQAAGEVPSAEALSSPAASDDAPVADKPSIEILRVAVQDLKATDVDLRLVKVASDSLLIELRKLKGVSVIGMDEIRIMLEQEANKAAMGCEDEDSCLADIASAMGAEELLAGTVASVGDELVFGLRRINQEEARVVGSVSKRLKRGDGEELLAAIGPVIAELYPDRALRAGQTRGVAEEVALKLNPPPLPPWVFWSMLATGAAVSMVAAGLLSGNVVVGAYYRLVVLPSLNKVGASYGPVGPTQVAVNVLLGAAVVATVAGAALLGAAAVTIPFTDFEGYQDAVNLEKASE